MKKIILSILVLVVLAAVPCHAVTYNVTKLVPAGGLVGTGSMTLPALVKSSAYGMKMIGLNLPSTRLAKIATAVAGLGGAIALDYAWNGLNSYMNTKGYRIGEDGAEKTVYSPSTLLYPTDVMNWGYEGIYSNDPLKPARVIVVGVFPNYAAADRAVLQAYQSYTSDPSTSGPNSNGYPTSSISPQNLLYNLTYLSGRYVMTSSLGAGNTYYYCIGLYPKTGYSGRYTNNTEWVDALASELTTLEGTMTTDLNNNVTGAIAAAWDAIYAAAMGLNDPSSPVGKSTAMPTIKTELDAAVTADQKLAIDATNQTPDEYAADAPGLTGDPTTGTLTPTDVQNAVIAALIAQGLSAAEVQTAVSAAIVANENIFGGGAGGGITAEEMQDIIDGLAAQGLDEAKVTSAVKAAIDDSTGVNDPTPPTFVDPDKLSLTSILQSFMTSIQNLPIVSTLQGISLTASGSPVLCMNLAEMYGGSRCWDASVISSELSNAGSAILAIVSMISFIGVFRG